MTLRAAALPERLKLLFWDAELQDLDLERHCDYVLGRVLELGTVEDCFWARRVYGDEAIARYLESSASRVLSDRTREFWSGYLRRKGIGCTPKSFPKNWFAL